MANQLSVIAGAQFTKHLVESNLPNVTIHMIGERQNNWRWTRGRDDLVKCFPSMRNFEFEGGSWNKEFLHQQAQQQAWLREDQQSMLEDVRSTTQVLCFEVSS